jgi:hypothetical protein
MVYYFDLPKHTSTNADVDLFASTRRKPRRYLVVAAMWLPAAVVFHRYLIVVPRLLPEVPLLLRHRYLIVVPRLLLAAPLAVRRTYLIVVLRPVPTWTLRRTYLIVVLRLMLRPLPEATRLCRIRRKALGR